VTRVRLPTTPIPPPADKSITLDGLVEGLCGVLTPRDEADTIVAQIEALRRRCTGVVVVDDGSVDGTVAAAEGAGARVLPLPAPAGEGAALKAGLRLTRELGFIGALVPRKEVLAAEVVDELARAHLAAPEAILLAVGPGEAIAGKEWEEAAAVARGEEPVPYPDFSPPRAPGLHGRVEDVFEAVVETRYAYPWGGPRILPLQAILRRRLRQNGIGIHMELLALAVKAGTPTVEVEVPTPPARVTPTCKRAAVTLLREFVPLVALSRVRDRLGLGSGYAPPTMSPLLLALGLGLAFAGTGCVKQVAVANPTTEPCAARAEWAGGGDAAAARDELRAGRAAMVPLMAQQQVDVDARGRREQLHGVVAFGARDELRVRVVVGPAASPVLDYLEAEGRWLLLLPTEQQRLAGEGRPDREALGNPDGALSPGALVTLLKSPEADAAVRWEPGACAVLQELDGDRVVRSLRLEPGSRLVVEDRLFLDGDPAVTVLPSDHRPVGEGFWPHRIEVRSLTSADKVVLTTRRVRTEGFDHLFEFGPG